MTALRTLASQTAIYGLSSILARFLNFLLTPLTSLSTFALTDADQTMTDFKEGTGAFMEKRKAEFKGT